MDSFDTGRVELRPWLLALIAIAGCAEDGGNPPPAPPAIEVVVRDGDPPPVIVVVVDTLRADRLGTYGYQRPTSVFFDRWCERGRVYENALATSPWTLPSMASILTGQYPSRHAAGSVVELEDDTTCVGLSSNVPTLAEVLRDHGWRTGAIMNNTFLAEEFGVGRGFEHYDFEATSELKIRRSDEVIDRALKWIDEQPDSRFFLVVHLFDPHTAYDPPESARGRFTAGLRSRVQTPVTKMAVGRFKGRLTPEERAYLSGAYDEEVGFVASQLNRMLTELEPRGVLAHGLVALTADHGEELFDHGQFSHGHALWQQLLHVPMVFWGRGVTAGREPAATSIVDVAPTVLEFLDIPPPGPLGGSSLWSNLATGAALPERLLYSEFCMYGGERKAVFQWPKKVVFDPIQDRQRMTDLVADPTEDAMVTELDPDSLALAKEAEAYLASLADQADQNAKPISPETMAGLKALGYADDTTVIDEEDGETEDGETEEERRD